MRTLAEQQAALMAALAGQSPAPPGFDAGRIAVSRRALMHKRTRAVRQAWPAVAELLGAEFQHKFSAYAANHAAPEHGGPMADGRAFVQWLDSGHTLNDRVRRQALDTDARWVRDARGCTPRRWPCIRAAWWPESRRWVLVFHWPGLRLRHLRIPARRR